tara:strand:+ start:1181 stop:1765 length:585 start_codon:yes stop_codon:yes gene_type:complete
MDYYIVTYSGPFGFIKPWTAVRDSETFSQQFLTPSIIEGMEKKLFPELLDKQGIHKIAGHRLSYKHLSAHQEVIQTRGWNSKRKGSEYLFERPTSILDRSILHEPILSLAFKTPIDAKTAGSQHLCLARNEDVVLPISIRETTKEEFETDGESFPGYELVFEETEDAFLVGYHRVTKEPMYGWIRIVGEPVTQY